MLNYKAKIISAFTAAAFVFTSSSYAFILGSGIYIGGQFGFAHADYSPKDFAVNKFDENNYAGRVYGGLQFNRFFGLETGYAMIASTELPRDFGEVHTTHWDLLFKAGMPIFSTGLRFDVKAGTAHVMTDYDASNKAKSDNVRDASEWNFNPVIGASLGYCVSRCVSFDLSYMHVYQDSKSFSFNTPSSDMLFLGVQFMFPLV